MTKDDAAAALDEVMQIAEPLEPPPKDKTLRRFRVGFVMASGVLGAAQDVWPWDGHAETAIAEALWRVLRTSPDVRFFTRDTYVLVRDVKAKKDRWFFGDATPRD